MERCNSLEPPREEEYGRMRQQKGGGGKPRAKRPEQHKNPPHEKTKKWILVDTGPHQPEPNPRTQPPDLSLHPHTIPLQDRPIPI